jgi:hypothetical protein
MHAPCGVFVCVCVCVLFFPPQRTGARTHVHTTIYVASFTGKLHACACGTAAIPSAMRRDRLSWNCQWGTVGVLRNVRVRAPFASSIMFFFLRIVHNSGLLSFPSRPQRPAEGYSSRFFFSWKPVMHFTVIKSIFFFLTNRLVVVLCLESYYVFSIRKMQRRRYYVFVSV